MLDDQQLAELFLARKIIDKEKLEKAKAISKANGDSLYWTMIQAGLVSEIRALLAISKALSIPRISLESYRPDPKILDLVPPSVIQTHQVIPMGMEGKPPNGVLYVAMRDPFNKAAMDELKAYSGLNISPLLAGPKDIQSALKTLKSYFGDMTNLPEVEVEIEEFDTPSKEAEEVLNLQEEGENLFGDFEAVFDHIDDTEGLPEPAASLGDSVEAPAKTMGISQSTLPANNQVLEVLKGITKDKELFGGVEPPPSEPEQVPTPEKPAPTPEPEKPEPPKKSVEGASMPHPPTSKEHSEQPAESREEPESSGSFSFADAWGDFDLDEDEEEVIEAKESVSNTTAKENSSIRYVVDPDLKLRKNQHKFPYDIPISDLVRAITWALVKRGILSQREIRMALRELRNISASGIKRRR